MASYYLVGPGPGEPETGPSPGRLSTNPSDSRGISSFVSNPAEPVVNPYDSSGAHDYQALSKRKDVLTFDSPPLDQDTEVTGPIRARVFLSCDCRDTDLWVRLLDVAPDGAALNVMGPGLEVQRASYRNAKRGRQLLRPRKIYEVWLDNLISSSVFQKGHRIRVQISATFFPNFSRNLHTGELEATSSNMRQAHINILHDARHRSRIILPVVQH